jgi:NAD(P)-dependent dehydrogenase (short-subunit alcohol dehydrogenase family)
MKSVVITGSTRGIGRGLSVSFLELGCSLVINGRRVEDVEQAIQDLASQSSLDRIEGFACDVSDYGQVQALWKVAYKRFGRVDIWINNAGISHPLGDFWDLDQQVMHSVVDTNLTGTLYGSKVAMQGMLIQGYGAIYNMEGLGSRGGRRVAGLALYGSTKAGLGYFTEALAQEAAVTPVIVGAISPGMVLPDMRLKRPAQSPQDEQRTRWVFSILADRVETVAPWLARRILKNERNGVRIAWLTPAKVMRRIMAAPFRREKVGRVQSEDGNPRDQG